MPTTPISWVTVGFGLTILAVPGAGLAPPSTRLRDCSRPEREVYVKTAEEAAELFIGVFQSRGSGPNGRAWKNTTGISKQETRNLHGTTNGTYHWDTGFDSDGVPLGHNANNPHSHTEHLQVHDFDGTIDHIFFRE